MRDIKSNVDVASTLRPQVYSANGTGTAVDLLGYDSAMAVFHAGDWTDGTHTPKLQHSDTTAGTDFADVGTDDLQGAFTAIDGTPDENAVQRVGYIGNKRYLRGFVTGTGTTGAGYGMEIMRGHPARRPLS